jgi:Na+/H+ antiporter NhaD/arsenite permease-like protein
VKIAVALAFIAGYAVIAAEQLVKLNKAAVALFTGVLCWTLFTAGATDKTGVAGEFVSYVNGFAGVLFFLMGAMVIVELIDLHRGFEVITRKITTNKKRALLWTIGVLAFFLSAVLDNLTTTIVMISLIVKLLPEKRDRLFFVSMVVIAANAGGAWTPIGDITTTMLWIGGHISPVKTMVTLFLPCAVCLVVPLAIASFGIRGETVHEAPNPVPVTGREALERNLVLVLGLGVLVFVPVFKMITGLPPFMGMMFGLSVFWIVIELLHRKKTPGAGEHLSVGRALSRIDMPAVLFFLGILISIAALDATGLLSGAAVQLDRHCGNPPVIALCLGLLSAVVDNVPLVAATMDMYHYPADNPFWLFVSYCVGAGGSILIIGSASGVAAMGISKINFLWYVKRITPLALAGYFAGAAVFAVCERFFF